MISELEAEQARAIRSIRVRLGTAIDVLLSTQAAAVPLGDWWSARVQGLLDEVRQAEAEAELS